MLEIRVSVWAADFAFFLYQFNRFKLSVLNLTYQIMLMLTVSCANKYNSYVQPCWEKTNKTKQNK